ncbi:MAG: amidohydrolase family protein [Chloroflexota bacterium]
MITVIKNAHILTLDKHDREIADGDLVVEGSKIVQLGEGVAARYEHKANRVIDARGLLVMPGLVNGHFHSTSAFMKGAFEGAPLEPYMLYEFPIGGFAHQPRLYYLRAMLASIELLKQGVTAVRDDVHFFGNPTDVGAASILEAYREAGIRASVGFGIANVIEYDKLPYLKELLTAEQRAAMAAEQLVSTEDIIAFYERLFANWHHSHEGRLTIHVSCSAPQRVTPETMQALSALAAKYDVSFDMHILETKTQRLLGNEKYGKSLVHYVNDLGVLNDHAVVIHGVWLDEQDMALIAEAGAVIAHNPVSNLKLGSGVMPFAKIMAHDIPICLGTDEASADDGTNLWLNAKMGALLQKIGDLEYRDWPPAAAYLDAMCRGGARALRREQQSGCLAVGRDADLIMLDLNSLAFTPLNHLKRQLVFAENGRSVVLTMVAGEIVCENQQMKRVDEEAIKGEIRQLMPQYRAVCDAANREADQLSLAYRQTYLKAAKQDVGFSRWLAQPPLPED